MLLRDVKLGSVFQDTATLLKVALILVIIAAGVLAGHSQPVSFFPAAGDGKLIASAPFAISLVYVMYAYSGWNASTYIVGEVRNPARAIPLSVGLGTGAVMLLYLAVNAIFLRTTPAAEMIGKLQVASWSRALHLFGATGAKVVAVLICAGLISTISAMMWIGPRVTVAMGEDLRALGWLARKSARGIPVAAILVQFAIVNVLLLTSKFEQVMTLRAVRAAIVLLPDGAGCHRPALAPPAPRAALQNLGLPRHTAHFPGDQRLDALAHPPLKPARIHVGPWGRSPPGTHRLLPLSGKIPHLPQSMKNRHTARSRHIFAPALFARDFVTANDEARYIAGLPLPGRSPLAAYTNDPGWKTHASEMDAAWAKSEERSLAKTRAWAGSYVHGGGLPCYYMFSGPDILLRAHHFPQRSCLCALRHSSRWAMCRTLPSFPPARPVPRSPPCGTRSAMC